MLISNVRDQLQGRLRAVGVNNRWRTNSCRLLLIDPER